MMTGVSLRACFPTLRTPLDCYNLTLPFPYSLSFNVFPFVSLPPFSIWAELAWAGGRGGGMAVTISGVKGSWIRFLNLAFLILFWGMNKSNGLTN